MRSLSGGRFEAVSVGTEAIRGMYEVGVGIPGQESKTLERYLGDPFAYVDNV